MVHLVIVADARWPSKDKRVRSWLYPHGHCSFGMFRSFQGAFSFANCFTRHAVEDHRDDQSVRNEERNAELN